MRRLLVGMVLANLCLADLGLPLRAECRSCCGRQGEPFIKFLDDLLCFPNGIGNRDPYEERMETERHDFTQSSTTVGRGVWQLESGYLYIYDDHHEAVEQAHVLPELLMRVGLSDDIEFRLRWKMAWQFFEEEPTREGAMDMIWSIKLQITEQWGWIPESALEIRSSVPSGGEAFSLGRVEAGFDYIYRWELTENWSLYGSSGYSPSALGDFSFVPDEPETQRFTIISQSLAVGTELTERNTMYLEWFGLYSHGLPEEVKLGFFNIGFDHYFCDDLLIDFRVGTGLNPESEDFFAGIGGGARF